MPTSAPGRSIADLQDRPASRRPAARRAGGFTLIEILVAITIGAVLVTVVGLSVGGADRGLQTDAERLSLLLSLAREEAQIRGAPIRFEADSSEYRFVIRRGERWEPILDDRDLRRRGWSGETRLRLSRLDGRDLIEFGRDMVDSPFELALQRGDQQAVIFTNGLGVFEVRQ
ncbi:MAG: GspH/FimT family pseudopilin [Burkholderiaceae bacterium]